MKPASSSEQPIPSIESEISIAVPVHSQGFDVVMFTLRAYLIEQRRFSAVQRAELREMSEFEEMDGEGRA